MGRNCAFCLSAEREVIDEGLGSYLKGKRIKPTITQRALSDTKNKKVSSPENSKIYYDILLKGEGRSFQEGRRF